MKRLNMELKARVDTLDPVREVLVADGARFCGVDRQCDTYFNVPCGRMKIRQGTVESCIVWYERPNIDGMRQCDYHLVEYANGDQSLESLRLLLAASLGIAVQVNKEREIYFIDAVKFHLDTVEGLGMFVEIEAIGETANDKEYLSEQCEYYRNRLGINCSSLIGSSYADLLISAETP